MMQRDCRILKPVRLWAFAAVLACAGAASAQYSEMGVSEVVSVADNFLKRAAYREAIPALKEIVSRLEPDPPVGMEETLQLCRFQLASAYYRTGDLESGLPLLEEYIANEPCKDRKTASLILSQGYFVQQQWDKVVTAAQTLISEPTAKKQEVATGNMLLGQALFRLERYKEAVGPLKIAARRADSKDDRAVMEIMVVRALVETGNYRELFVWVPRLYRTDAKYDITLNLTLMQAAKQRFDQPEPDYLNALLLYRMVLPRDVLLDFQEKNVAELQRKLAVAVKQGIKEEDRKDRQAKIDQINESMTLLRDLPPYEDEVMFRIGQIYSEVKRYWEGYTLYDQLYKNTKDSNLSEMSEEIGEAAMVKSVLVLYDLGQSERAEKRVITYLEDKPEGRFVRDLLSLIMKHDLEEKGPGTVTALKGYLKNLPKAATDDQRQQDAFMHYMLAFAHLKAKEYEQAEQEFGIVVDDYPNSPQLPDATYYRGMCFMLEQNYLSAIDYFTLYLNNYGQLDGVNHGEYAEESLFRQGVCYYGVQDVAEAERIFTDFIGRFPEHALVSEAYSMRGDIEAAKEGDDKALDRAVKDYRNGLEKATLPEQASYAAFQAAKVYELEEKWQEISELMDFYQDSQGASADIAKAVYWSGKAKMNMGEVNEAIDQYVDAIRRYGNDTAQEGVDKIISELVLQSYGLEPMQLERLKTKLDVILSQMDENVDRPVLKVRLQVAQASIEGESSVIQLGKQLLRDEKDLTILSPLSLALLCDAAIELGDVEPMEPLYNYFVMTYPESDLLWKAYRLKCTQLELEGDYEGVLDVIETAQETFGADEYMGWAQVLKGNMMIKVGLPKQAFEEFQMVFGVPAWRGPLVAESVYGMGEAKLADGELEQATTFFTRTYLLYKGLADGEWAAKAYLADAEVRLLLAKNHPEEKANAIKAWEAMLADEYVKDRPEADVARKMLKKYGSAE